MLRKRWIRGFRPQWIRFDAFLLAFGLILSCLSLLSATSTYAQNDELANPARKDQPTPDLESNDALGPETPPAAASPAAQSAATPQVAAQENQTSAASTKSSTSANQTSTKANKTSMPARERPIGEAAPEEPVLPPYDNPDNPHVQSQNNPYQDLPSLKDLYGQFPEGSAPMRRFGSDVFLEESGNTNELPMDLPAGPDYVLGPGDYLTINMWGSISNRLSRIIDRQGEVALPEAGTVMVDGLTIAQAQVAIQKLLDTQLRGEHVEISLGRVRTVRVYVVGDVQRPGAYDVSSLSTPLGALYAAGGPTSRGSLRILRQYRGNQLVRQVDLYDFFLHGVHANDQRLLSGDTILVPTIGPQVTVQGAVRRPAIYELNGDENLSQVLDLAGGALVSASLKQIEVERIEAHEKRTMFSLKLPDNAQDAQQKLTLFSVRDGDNVVISQILPYNSQAVYLEGHVFHPGKYSYRDGMTVADLLRSYQDVMPEPSDHAELVRLEPPDYRPATISFNLPDVLIGNQSISLRPFDLVRIYGRYDIDSPMVTIHGEVLRPGRYPMARGMTAAQLVEMAGGFKRSAYRVQADLSSYTVENDQRVLVDHKEISLEKAVEGDKGVDVPLKPDDVLSIRRLAGWQDIGATVTINGEVEHAGTYGIESGERLSSVLKRAGGFRSDAYPYAAVLERVQVRDLNEQARQEMIQRIEETPLEVRRGMMASQAATDTQESLQTQRQQILTTLRNRPASGRMVINISLDISKWENTPADIELRPGDALEIPKKPNFVVISGQVFNPVAISYVPGKDLGWYLRRAGGVTPTGNKRDIYVLRADGAVVPRGAGWMGGGYMGVRMHPGDTVFVPEKIVAGSQVWQNILGAAQMMSVAALPIAIAGGL